MYYLVKGSEDNLEYFTLFDYSVGAIFTKNKDYAKKIPAKEMFYSLYATIIKLNNARFIPVD